jgi:exodeoxyribonuclease VII large subunit
VTGTGPHTRPTPDVLSVSQLTKLVHDLLEDTFPLLWVEGEISNLSRPASGHVYLTLKDEGAQVRCALFRNRGRLLRFTPDNGMRVRVRARVGLYAARGDFQLIIEHMEEAGDGALLRAFEQLKAKLAEAGLFAPEGKRQVPRFPRRVGVISSPSGAALRDVLDVLGRRFPALPVLIYPVAVQGANAVREIVDALAKAGTDGRCDTLIVARGGGSLEDLQAFNEEPVARAIAACPLPIVSGIGHETDTTIADYVADVRAPTPSAAAELVAPSGDEWFERFGAIGHRFQRQVRERLERGGQGLDWLERRLLGLHPGRRIIQRTEQLAHRKAALVHGIERKLQARRAAVDGLGSRLMAHSPQARLADCRTRMAQLRARIEAHGRGHIATRQARMAVASRALGAVSPLATLDRGYSILRRADDGVPVTRIDQTAAGEHIVARLADGELQCTVDGCIERIEPEPSIEP